MDTGFVNVVNPGGGAEWVNWGEDIWMVLWNRLITVLFKTGYYCWLARAWGIWCLTKRWCTLFCFVLFCFLPLFSLTPTADDPRTIFSQGSVCPLCPETIPDCTLLIRQSNSIRSIDLTSGVEMWGGGFQGVFITTYEPCSLLLLL